MDTTLTEDLIRSMSTAQSYQRGLAYYHSHAILETYRQGNTLVGECEGNSAPYYQLRVELDESGVKSASCNCEYNWGGICKHLVAFLLTYVYDSDRFIERAGVPSLLASLDRDALVSILVRLAGKDPSLYDWLESQAHLTQTQASDLGTANGITKSHTPVSAQNYQRQIKNILHRTDRYSSSERYWGLYDMVEELDGIAETAWQFLESGDAEGGLIILTTLLEEVASAYELFDDSDGDLGSFLDDLAIPTAEAILTLDLSSSERESLSRKLRPLIDEMDDYGVERLSLILTALEYGGDTSPLAGDDEEEGDGEDEWPEDEWPDVDWEQADLTAARLNVLDRQEKVNEYLSLCLQAHEYRRYAIKLVELGRAQEAIDTAVAKLTYAPEALEVAQVLQEKGNLDGGLIVGERGLSLDGDKSELGNWLGPQEEAQGRPDMAFQAYRAAFASDPSLPLYKTLERLSGNEWKPTRKWAIEYLRSSSSPDILVEVYLMEQDWDAAAKLAEKTDWDYHLLERVADALIPHRSGWVIEVSTKQAQQLIDKTQGKYYQIAANWLEKARNAYLQSGRQNDWQSYISNLRASYPRRRALQDALKRL
jgi:uncharacterized Zn finger protein